MLLINTSIHHHHDPGFLRFLRSLKVNHSFLQPEMFNSQFNGFIDMWHHEFRVSKDIDRFKRIRNR